MTTVTVLSGPERRRRWTSGEKLRIVEESLTGQASVAEVARRNDIHPNLLHQWRHLVRKGRLGADQAGVSFAQAVVACEAAIASPPSSADGAVTAASRAGHFPAVMAGRMEIVLGHERRVIVDKDVDADALVRVIAVLEQ